MGWRGVPILPCDKIPINEDRTTSIIVMRTGKDDQGVVGLHRTGLPDEVEPGISVRRMEVSEKAITTYLVSTYFSGGRPDPRRARSPRERRAQRLIGRHGPLASNLPELARGLRVDALERAIEG